MTTVAADDLQERLSHLMDVRPIGVDDFSPLRYLHAKSLIAQTVDAVSDAQAETLIRLIYSPEYSDVRQDEEIYGGWIDGELVGTASWHTGRDANSIARIGPVFVRHPRFGIGRRLLSEVEARARQCGFRNFSAWSPADAVPFFQRLGYDIVSRGVKSFAPGCALPVTFLRKEVAA